MNPFTIDPKILNQLSAERAVDIFRRLLWAEAARVGVAQNLVSTPLCIYEPDGGIDAGIEVKVNPTCDDLIPQGISGFQIKSGDLPPKKCRAEVSRELNGRLVLKEEVERIISNDGTYVLVLFKELNIRTRRSRREELEKLFADLGFPHAKVIVYGIEIIQRSLERFISLVFYVRGEQHLGIPHEFWGDQTDIRFPGQVVFDDLRDNFVEELRDAVRNRKPGDAVWRVSGLPGVGKSRLVYEALNTDDLKHQVVYIPQYIDSAASTIQHLRINGDVNAVLVVDDCDNATHERLTNGLANYSDRITLITLTTEVNRFPFPTRVVFMTPMSETTLESLLTSQNASLPSPVSRRIAKFSGGFPRIAVLLLDSYLKFDTSLEHFGDIEDDHLFNRLIGGETNTSDGRFAEKVLFFIAIALFEKIEFPGDSDRESQWLSRYFKIDWNRFQELVSEERRRGLIQGQYYLSLTPFILRVWLRKRWLTTYCTSRTQLYEFINAFPIEDRIDLTSRFVSLFSHIGDIPEGISLSNELLSESGMFDEQFLDTEQGSYLFLKLAEGNPSAALSCLEYLFSGKTTDELKAQVSGRRNIVWALEMITVWKELCVRGARILSALALAENENYANNSTGVFCKLFIPAQGIMSMTEANPEERFVVIDELLRFGSFEKQTLALSACECALSTPPYTKMMGSETQGLRRLPDYWSPRSTKELTDAYLRVWNALLDLRKTGDETSKVAIEKVLFESCRGLCRVPGMQGPVVAFLESIGTEDISDVKKYLESISAILSFEDKYLSEEQSVRLLSLRDGYVNKDFNSRFKRYVGMSLYEDWSKDDRHETLYGIIHELAQEVVANPDQLAPYYNWLNSREPVNTQRFGLELGIADSENKFRPDIIQSILTRKETDSMAFVGGYFAGLQKRDGKLWDSVMEEFQGDDGLKKFILELTWHSGLTNAAATRVLNLVKDRTNSVAELSQFLYGGELDKLDVLICNEWLTYAVEVGTNSALLTAVIILHAYFIMPGRLHDIDPHFALQILTHPSVFARTEEKVDVQMSNYRWSESALKLLDSHPQFATALGSVVVDHYNEKGTVFEGYEPSSSKVLSRIGDLNPKLLWDIMKIRIVPPLDERGWSLAHWMRGDRGFTSEVNTSRLPRTPLKEIWKWIDEDPEVRTSFLAEYVPPVLTHDSSTPSLPFELLKRYGDNIDVHKALFRNFYSEGWSGNASSHYRRKQDMLREIRKSETNSNIIVWLDTYIGQLDAEIRRAIKEEERGLF
jgi:hypothetical protein